jgi:nucleotide-binding universal stress UspA family protein
MNNMRTVLVPTDFSDTARNAARYAFEFAAQLSISKIVLFHAYQPPLSADPAMPSIEFLDLEELKKNSEQGLQTFLNEVKKYSSAGIQIETKSDFSLLSENINDVCDEAGADIIIMGITGGGKLEEVLIGSNTISVADHSTRPVIIVPSQSGFKEIKNVLLACDFTKVIETTPVSALRQVLDTTKAKLHVINVSDNEKNDEDIKFESLMLDTLLHGYSPQYHFIHNSDFTEATNRFAEENNIDIIITIPKKHGWFEGLFRRRRTKSLAFHTHVPLMVIHE